MKRVLRFFKYLLFAFIGFIILGVITVYVGHKFIFPIPYSATATIPDIKDNGFCFGINCQNAPKTAEKFIPVFAEQIKNYNKNAPSLWPDNKVTDLYAAVESIENDKSWLISPDGKIKVLSKKELTELCPSRARYNIGFQRFENDSIQGVYLALSEEALANVLEYQNYQYLGTYDLLLTFNHEMFHQMEQDSHWAQPETIDNRSRDGRLDHPEARTERHLIYQFLLQAYAAQRPEERDFHIMQAISNYEHYKKTYPEDFKAAKYYDRIEGTAYYYEIISSLYSAYPDQINSYETLRNSLKVLAKSNNHKPYETSGVDNESYILGAWAGFLLDELQEDNSQWKIEIMQNSEVTPLDLLARYYAGMPLPKATTPTPELQEKVNNSITDAKNKKVAPGIFRFLYQLIF